MSKERPNDKLWGGRFESGTDAQVESFTASEHFDRRLARFDIAGSIAHARMLHATGLLTEAECRQICDGLEAIEAEIAGGDFEWSPRLEDVHMNIESRLTQMLGDAGKKLHTARSRNDQVATDMRLFVRDAIDRLCASLAALQMTLAEVAEREAETIMPGFTHLQTAQPVTFGHHLLAWGEMLERDVDRLTDCRRRVNVSPLGCAALAGTGHPIDREMTASLLGFEQVARNSLDAVSDRDFLIEFSANGALLAIHLTRIAEELILWASDAFQFVDLGDRYCTGSSIMPQKRNPDVAELVRGKSGRVIGNLVALLTLMKSQPLAYNRDNQEDKEPVFDSVDTLTASVEIFAAMIGQMKVNREAMRTAAARGYSTATDLADYLVAKGIPFRVAHEIVGQVVQQAEQSGVQLAELSLDRLRAFSDRIDEDVFQVLTLEGSVNARDHIGGTAPVRVIEAARRLKERLTARGESQT
jgi:argininosuccinate lyase